MNLYFTEISFVKKICVLWAPSDQPGPMKVQFEIVNLNLFIIAL